MLYLYSIILFVLGIIIGLSCRRNSVCFKIKESLISDGKLKYLIKSVYVDSQGLLFLNSEGKTFIISIDGMVLNLHDPD